MTKKLYVKIKPIGLFDMLAFKKLVPNRRNKIQGSSDICIQAEPAMNILAKKMHPQKQDMMVKDIIKENDNVTTFCLEMKNGSKPAFFRAGQYISLRLKIDDSVFTRPYSLSSSPKQSLEGCYYVTIKHNEEGYFSKWVMENWKKGTEVEVSAPEGSFYYESVRDAKTVIGICGGSGVTPFMSMAKAIAEGSEDFNLTILYGSCKVCDILFKEELDALVKASKGKINVAYVLSEEQNEDYEQGFISAEIIKKYAPKGEKFSVFICGPQVMYNFVSKELEGLKLEQKFIRRELFGELKMIDKIKGYPKEAFGKVFKLVVKTCGDKKEIPARSDESILVALERSGIAAPSKCRSGECGYCRSKLISGDVFIPDDNDGRRAADKKFGFLHPCASYPVSDIEMELPN